MWVGIGSIIMMFAGLTSAYIVRRAQGSWMEFAIPTVFWVSTIVIIFSSISLFFAEKAIKQNNHKLYKYFLGLTTLLGFAFVGLQYKGWLDLQSIGVLLEGNPSGAFVYVISGLHALHVLGGILFLIIFVGKTLLQKDVVKRLMDEINPHRFLGIEIFSTYWHFIGILWVYLLVFFALFR